MAKIRFQLDEHASTVIADQLRRRDIDALTTHEAGLRGASDTEHIRTALENLRVLVTEDDDFLTLVARGHDHAGIAFFPGGVRTISDVVNALVLIHGMYTAEAMIGRIEYL